MRPPAVTFGCTTSGWFLIFLELSKTLAPEQYLIHSRHGCFIKIISHFEHEPSLQGDQACKLQNYSGVKNAIVECFSYASEKIPVFGIGRIPRQFVSLSVVFVPRAGNCLS